MVLLAVLLGCRGAAECGPAECAELCAPDAPPPADPGLSEFEHRLLDELLADVRRGVQPFGEEGIGICRGDSKTGCPDYLGLEAGELPPGEYMVRAELDVPDVGERGTWSVRFDTACTYTTVGSDGEERTTHKEYTREYDVIHVSGDRGFRLQPLRQITSPTSSGARESCTWTLTAAHPDGDGTWSGSWTVPAEG